MEKRTKWRQVVIDFGRSRLSCLAEDCLFPWWFPCEVHCMNSSWSWQILSPCSILSTKIMCNFRAAAIYLLIYLWACWPGSIKLVIKNSVWLWGCLFSVAACKLCSMSLLYFYWRDGSCLLLLVTVSSCSPQAWMLKSLLQLHLKIS